MILEFIQDLKSSVKIHLKSQWVSSFKDITTAANLRAIRCIVTLRWQLLTYLSHDCFIRAWYVSLGKSSRKWCLQRRNFIDNLFYKNKSSAPWGERKVFSWSFCELFIFAGSNKPDFPGALRFPVTSRPNYKFSLYQQAEISRKLKSNSTHRNSCHWKHPMKLNCWTDDASSDKDKPFLLTNIWLQ